MKVCRKLKEFYDKVIMFGNPIRTNQCLVKDL